MRVWDRARTAADIRADFMRDVPANTPGLTLDLRFNEAPDAITIEDSSPSDNSGSIISGNQRYDDPERVPFLATAGDYPVTLRVDDGKGGISDQRFSVRVTSPFSSTISGTVYDDANGDGVRGRRPVDNLLVNGDFTSGAVGFTSSLAPSTYSGTDYNSQRPGVYTVGNALAALPGTNFQFEHTSRSGAALLVTASSAMLSTVRRRPPVHAIVALPHATHSNSGSGPSPEPKSISPPDDRRAPSFVSKSSRGILLATGPGSC